MSGRRIRNPKADDAARIGTSAFYVFAADLELVVDRMAVEYEQGMLSSHTARQVKKLLRLAEQFDTDHG